jgi:phosphoglycerate dehydrogenase-like enzyme
VEILFSGWGGPVVDAELLKYVPNLKLYLYAGGTPKGIFSKEFDDLGVTVSSSVEQNSYCVAEYTLGFILLALKRALPLAMRIRAEGTYPPMQEKKFRGNYGATVGLVSLGCTAQYLVDMLVDHDHKLIAYDPYFDKGEALKMGVQLVELDELFSTSDVVSVHSPLTSETNGMITGDHVRLMKPSTTLINTSRGRVFDEDSVVHALIERPDVYAVLDVATSEPPAQNSPLYTLQNVLMTPHIAGALFDECQRLGDAMIDEAARFMAGHDLHYQALPPVSAFNRSYPYARLAKRS